MHGRIVLTEFEITRMIYTTRNLATHNSSVKEHMGTIHHKFCVTFLCRFLKIAA